MGLNGSKGQMVVRGGARQEWRSDAGPEGGARWKQGPDRGTVG